MKYIRNPDGKVVDGWYVVDIYRGSDTTDVTGISWWTTDYNQAKIYAETYKEKGLIMHRTIKLPVCFDGVTLYNPSPYLVGGRGGSGAIDTTKDVDMERYYYGIDMDIRVDKVEHFVISIHDSILKNISRLVDIDKPHHVEIPKELQITFKMEEN